MQYISLAGATTLTGWSERTFWRKLSDGSVTRSPSSSRAMIAFNDIKAYSCIPLEPEDLLMIEQADSGDAAAQTETAILFLQHDKPKSAVYWLDLATKHDDANAMYLLGRCYTDGSGIPVNENLGIMWIAKAASLNHVLAQGLMRSMRNGYLNQT